MLSSCLPLAERVLGARSANADVPLFRAHGGHDPVVPEPLGKLARDRLRSLGYAVDWHSYPMAHQVCAEDRRPARLDPARALPPSERDECAAPAR